MPEPESLDTDEPLPRRLERHAFDRLIMLSDGVFAIAITLAAIEIRPPEEAFASATGVLSALGSSLATYAISFAVIGAYWLAHRRMFALLRRVDPTLSLLNLLLLGLLALQPAGVALLIHAGPRGGALNVYFGMIIALGLVQTAMWGYAAFPGGLLYEQVTRRYRVTQLLISLFLPIVAAALGIFSSRTGSRSLMLLAAAGVLGMAILRRRLAKLPT